MATMSRCSTPSSSAPKDAPSSAVMVYITTPDRETAESIARGLVARHLAACANLIEGVTSVFFWEGEVRQDQECIVLAKSRGEAMDALVETVKSLHPYECPCIVALPIVAGAEDFIHWIEEQVPVQDTPS